MVRLVFRPYTQIRRTICTSVSLRASTRVSPGFTLFRHSSPSFGSQHICSYSDQSDKSRPVGAASAHYNGFTPSHFHSASGFATQTLAHMLDSLVRVSRRAGYKHFVLVKAKHSPVNAATGSEGYTRASTLPPLRPSAATVTDENIRIRTGYSPVGA